MFRDDIYKYFKLKANVYSAIFDFVKKKLENTSYKDLIFKIKDVELLAEGMLSFNIEFCVSNEIKYYTINIKELEEF